MSTKRRVIWLVVAVVTIAACGALAVVVMAEGNAEAGPTKSSIRVESQRIEGATIYLVRYSGGSGRFLVVSDTGYVAWSD